MNSIVTKVSYSHTETMSNEGADKGLPLTVPCNGKSKDGSPCSAHVDVSSDFCGKCGTPISKYRSCSGIRNGNICNFSVPEDCGFCPKCGKQFTEPETNSRKIYCTGLRNGQPCEAELTADVKFCGKCGTSRQADSSTTSQDINQQGE